MRIDRSNYKCWSKDELNTLKNSYGVLETDEIKKLLPNRTWCAIKLKAHIFGLKHKHITYGGRKHSEETKRKMRLSHSKTPNPATRSEVRRKISENNPMKRPEIVNKISKIRKDFWVNNPELKKEYSKRMSGKNNWKWKGGIRPRPELASQYWREIRNNILERDGYKCVSCSSSEDLVIHHKKPICLFESYKDADFDENLVTLCRRCHGKYHGAITNVSNRNNK